MTKYLIANLHSGLAQMLLESPKMFLNLMKFYFIKCYERNLSQLLSIVGKMFIHSLDLATGTPHARMPQSLL